MPLPGQRAAEFHSRALGWEITFSEGPYSGISDGSVTIEFNAVEGYQRPQWPDVGGAEQFHLELTVDRLDDAVAELIAAGGHAVAWLSVDQRDLGAGLGLIMLAGDAT